MQIAIETLRIRYRDLDSLRKQRTFAVNQTSADIDRLQQEIDKLLKHLDSSKSLLAETISGQAELLAAIECLGGVVDG